MSTTQKYDPYENAVAERINGILKYEFGLRKTLSTVEVAKKMMKQAVEIYNKERLHWSLDLQTPQQVHTGYNKQKYKSYEKSAAWLSIFELFMWGWKRAMLRSNPNSAKTMNALEMNQGANKIFAPQFKIDSFLEKEKTKKNLITIS